MEQDDPGPVPAGPMADRLRALLERAAAEQVVEQRQASAVLADLRRLVAELDARLRLLEERSAALPDQVAELLRAASAGTEQRVRAHVDEAVLALAEALLRRPSGRSAGPDAPRPDP